MHCLTGIRVLETATLLPGPWCGVMLAELGADVIKVEPPEGDPARHYPPFLPAAPASGAPDRGSPQSAVFLSVNRGKRSIVLDLKTHAGRATFLDLVRTADVVSTSWRPGVGERLGLDHAAIAAANPRIVTCSITGYGERGPRRDRPGHDVNYQAWAGTIGLTGSPRTGPAIPGVLVADLAGGTFPAVVSILAALLERERTGGGRHIDVAMAPSTVPLLQMMHAFHAAGVPAPEPGEGPFTGGFPNFRVYPTKDGHIAVGALEPKFWIVFCETLGLPDLAGDGYAVGERRDEVVRRIEVVLATATAAEWEMRFEGKETCVERVRRADEVFADPWLAESGVVLEVDHPAVGKVPQMRALPAWPIRIDLGPPPLLGQHTDEILAEIASGAR